MEDLNSAPNTLDTQLPMEGAFYDYECYENFFCATFIDILTPQHLVDDYITADIEKNIVKKKEALSKINHKQFVLHKSRNDLNAFYDFLTGIKLLIGFNNSHYDDVITDTFLIRKNLWYGWTDISEIVVAIHKVSDEIINSTLNYRYNTDEIKSFKSPYASIDLMSALFETINRKSLKQTAINLKWYRIQDLPIHPSAWITTEQVEQILDYNTNDSLITRALYHHSHDELMLKVRISKQFGVNALSANRSKIADLLLIKLYSEYTGMKYYQYKDKRTPRLLIPFKDIINERIEFKTLTFQTLLRELKSYTYHVGEQFNKLVLYQNRGYTMATGGLHSVDRPELFVSTDDYYYGDADVSSYYPNLVINEGVSPAHLAYAAFQAIAKFITAERMSNKALAKAAKKIHDVEKMTFYGTGADAYKIVANSGLFGKLGYDGWMLDLKAMYQTTINGQLYLMMLIEELETNGIPVVSANTDGIVCKIANNKEALYKVICERWQEMTRLSLEFTQYYKYARTTVNDYLAIKRDWLTSQSDDDIKRKGDFLTSIDIQKGYNAPIIAKAISDKVIYDIDGRETILTGKDIYDYCISVKTGENFVKEIHSIHNGEYKVEEMPKNLRYFVSTNGGTLLKNKVSESSISNMLKGYNITPFNDYYVVDDYHVDYRYYNRKYGDLWLKMIGSYSKPKASRRVTVRKPGSSSRGTTQVGKLFD